MRKLARIVTIDGIEPIAGADAIEAAVIGGWKVVVKKGEYTSGDRAIYIEIDSFLPTGNPAWQFLVDKSSRTFNDVKGHVLRTVKLRGQVSQGLLIKPIVNGNVGDDVTEQLGIIKYEPPIPAELAGQVLGHFPSVLIKSDQERVQNMDPAVIKAHTYEMTEKLDGTSCTMAIIDGEFVVCSRNLRLAPSDTNTFWRVAKETGMEERLRKLPYETAIQGEIIGPGIQGNHYKVNKHLFFAYNLYNVKERRWFNRDEYNQTLIGLGALTWDHRKAHEAFAGVFYRVPELLIAESYQRETLFNLNVDVIAELLKMIDGATSEVGGIWVLCEGVVFKNFDRSVQFKVISNKFLLGQKD